MKRKLLLYILLFVLVIHSAYAQQTDLRFSRIGLQDGLSNPTVFDIEQDHHGFLWLATEDGLNRYDGYDFTVYRHSVNDSTSLSDSRVNCVLVDSQGRVWVGTGNGLNLYDENFDNFRRFFFSPAINVNPANRIRCLYEDSNKFIWVGTDGGLQKISPSDLSVVNAFSSGKDSTQISHDVVRSIYEDADGFFWIGTHAGLDRYNPGIDQFSRIQVTENQNFIKEGNSILSICPQDIRSDSILWIGAMNGLVKFNRLTGVSEYFGQKEGSQDGLSNNIVKAINGPHGKYLWLGTDRGLTLIDIQSDLFYNYYHDPFNQSSLANDVIWCVYKDRSGVIWLGTDNGICMYDQNASRFRFFEIVNKNGEFNSGAVITNFVEDSENTLWLSSSNGFIKYDLQKGVTKWLEYENNNPSSLPVDKITNVDIGKNNNFWLSTTSGLVNFLGETNGFRRFQIDNSNKNLIYEYPSGVVHDQSGKLWFGFNGGGVVKMTNWENERWIENFVHDRNDGTGLSSNLVTVVEIDREGNLWAGTENGGVNRISQPDGSVKSYLISSSNFSGLSNNYVNCIHADIKQVVWVGTKSGLNKYNVDADRFEFFLKETAIMGIQGDKNGNLWLSTPTSILKFNPNTDISTEFLLPNLSRLFNFTRNSSYQDNEGFIYFGGTNGFIKFHPGQIVEDKYDPMILITGLEISKQAILPNKKYYGNNILNKPIHKTNKIELSYLQNSLTFNFVSFHLSSPKNISYKFKLEGFDHDWQETKGQNYAIYSNLRPGKYSFKVTGTNSSGVWSSHHDSIAVVIDPPFWKTSWAITIYVLLIFGLLFLVQHVMSIRLKWMNELKLEKLEREKLSKINDIKLRFFTNISHEFRTPLTLIIGPLESAISKLTDGSLKQQLEIARKNSGRLLRLINQIMDFRKLESGDMELFLQQSDIVSFASNIYNSFSDLASSRRIEYTFHSDIDKILVWFDYDKIDKVLYNLLSNAFKFTYPEGSISLIIDQPRVEKEFVRIRIKDSGKGISESKLKGVFTRFYQIEPSPTRMAEGTGIGLSLSKELADLHHGRLDVESEEGKGSTFSLYLPIEGAVKMSKSIDVKNQEVERATALSDTNGETIDNQESDLKGQKYKLLIVEDNEEMRFFIRENLQELYEIVEAENGEEGFTLAIEQNPDIIISDIMMEKMDGIELCKKIKSELDISHIPVILLTARNTLESKIEGLSVGADDYIEKPFYIEHLHARIQNLLAIRQILQKKYKSGTSLEPSEITITSLDEEFIKKVIAIIEKHMDDPDFAVKDICKEMNVSHACLYRKLKSLADQNVNEFVRTIRLKRAAQLLHSKGISISEVSYSTGFSSRSYFSQIFSQMYGMSPKDYYRKIHETEDPES